LISKIFEDLVKLEFIDGGKALFAERVNP